MEHVINLRLMSHPLNWLIVWTVLAFAAVAAMHAVEAVGGECGCGGALPD